jgi:UDP-N-acetylmuramoyl-L-alanyl-D-glutamate--2,6-diaminopimelate ligase
MKQLSWLCHGLNCRFFGDASIKIKGIASHSQKIKPGYLFVAIDGYRTTGKTYIKSAIKKGAKAIATSDESTARRISEEYQNKVTAIRTQNPRQFLAIVANRFFDFPARKLNLVGITGTDGKTTTSYMIKSIIEANGEKTGLIGTIKYFDGVSWLSAPNTTPESIELVEFLANLVQQNIHYCISEVSSHALALDRITGLDFKVAVFTNLAHDHLDFHKTRKAYGETKLKLFQNLSPTAFAIINYDDKFSKKIINKTQAKIISYALNRKSNITAKIISVKSNGTEVIVKLPSSKPIVMKLPMLGQHNIYNLLAAIGTALTLRIPQRYIKIGIEKLIPIPGRLERIKTKKEFDVYIDYAHTPKALYVSISTLKEIAKRHVIIVFGCGGNRDPIKRPLMGKIATELADYVIVTSDNPRFETPRKIISEIEKGIRKKNYEVIINRDNAIKYALRRARPHDIVLIAGKGHENYQIIGDTKIKFSDKAVVLNALNN